MRTLDLFKSHSGIVIVDGSGSHLISVVPDGCVYVRDGVVVELYGLLGWAGCINLCPGSLMVAVGSALQQRVVPDDVVGYQTLFLDIHTTRIG